MSAVPELLQYDSLENARLAVEQDPVRTRIEASRTDDERALAKAILLSPNLDVCEALLRGENVPVSRLDPYWAKAYGLK